MGIFRTFLFMFQSHGSSAYVGRVRSDVPDDHHLPAPGDPDVLLLLQGHHCPLEVHQEHDRPHQHQAVQHGPSYRSSGPHHGCRLQTCRGEGVRKHHLST